MNKRGQSWSIDVVLAIVIFGFIAIAFTSFALLSQPDIEELQNSAERVTIDLESSVGACNPVIVNDTIDNNSIMNMFNLIFADFLLASFNTILPSNKHFFSFSLLL